MEHFEIRLATVIDARRARALGCERVAEDNEGSRLRFDAPDQTALYGLLARLRDMGVPLVDVHRIEPPAVDRAARDREEPLDVS